MTLHVLYYVVWNMNQKRIIFYLSSLRTNITLTATASEETAAVSRRRFPEFDTLAFAENCPWAAAAAELLGTPEQRQERNCTIFFRSRRMGVKSGKGLHRGSALGLSALGRLR